MTPVRRSRGFALMLAVFLIVTLAAVAAYLLTVQTGQAQAVAQDEQAVAAQLAARTGLEVAAYQILRANAACPAVNQTIVLGQRLTGFSVTVQCASFSENEGAEAIELFRITSTGCNRATCPGAVDATYVERQLHLTLAR
jgi:MSHA biogenesis protein MshP